MMGISGKNLGLLNEVKLREMRLYLYKYFVWEAYTKDEVDLDGHAQAYRAIRKRHHAHSITRLGPMCKVTGAGRSVLAKGGFMLNRSELKRTLEGGDVAGFGPSSW